MTATAATRLIFHTRPQKLGRQPHITEGGGQADAPHPPADGCFHPMQQRLQLPSPLVADEGVQLIHHHRFQAGEQAAQFRAPAKQQGFQRFRGNQHHPARVGEETFARRLADIAMPRRHRQIQPFADQAEALVLVIDQRLHRRHIEQQALAFALPQTGKQWQKRRLGLAGSGGGGDHHIPLTIQ